MVDQRGTSIHTDQGLSLDHVPQDDIELAQDPFPPDPDPDPHQEDEVVEEIAPDVMVVGEDVAQVTVATAVMMIEVEAEAVAEEDVGGVE